MTDHPSQVSVGVSLGSMRAVLVGSGTVVIDPETGEEVIVTDEYVAVCGDTIWCTETVWKDLNADCKPVPRTP